MKRPNSASSRRFRPAMIGGNTSDAPTWIRAGRMRNGSGRQEVPGGESGEGSFRLNFFNVMVVFVPICSFQANLCAGHHVMSAFVKKIYPVCCFAWRESKQLFLVGVIVPEVSSSSPSGHATQYRLNSLDDGSWAGSAQLVGPSVLPVFSLRRSQSTPSPPPAPVCLPPGPAECKPKRANRGGLHIRRPELLFRICLRWVRPCS